MKVVQIAVVAVASAITTTLLVVDAGTHTPRQDGKRQENVTGSMARDSFLHPAVASAAFDSANRIECLDAVDPKLRCVIFTYQTARLDDPLDYKDMAIAEVGQALEQGDEELAAALVEKRSAVNGDDEVQKRIESLIENGLPVDHKVDPNIHPSSGSERTVDKTSRDLPERLSVVDQALPATSETWQAVYRPKRAPTLQVGKVNAYKETTSANLTWKCSCGTVTAKVKVSESTFLGYADYDIYQIRKTDLVSGPSYSLKNNYARVRYERSGFPDTTVHDWNRQYDAIGVRWTEHQSSNWNFRGTKGAYYHSDWSGSVDPGGSSMGSKSFKLRGTSWRYPKGGGLPSFP